VKLNLELKGVSTSVLMISFYSIALHNMHIQIICMDYQYN